MAISVKVTVTAPKTLLNEAVIRDKIEQALRRQTEPDIKRQFQKTVEGWKHPPDWSQKFTNQANYISVAVWASGANKEQYALVNYGSPAHTITPKRRGGLLRFQPGYRSATRPKILSSRAPQRSGEYVTAFAVKHPGFSPRHFDEAVAEEIAPRFVKDVQDAISLGASSGVRR